MENAKEIGDERSSLSFAITRIIELMKNPSKQDIDLVNKAFNYAKSVHQGQKRFSREPYFIHCIETAKLLADIEMNSIVISAGLLHDCIEDGKAEEEEFKKEFGDEILFLVNGVTKLGKLKYRGVQRYRENLRKFFVAVSQDIRVIIIKLADRLHNMQTLKYVKEDKQERIAVETLEIYVPVACRLGIRVFSRQLEDLAFSFVYPKEYEKTKELLKIKSEKDLLYFDKFQKSIRNVLIKNRITKFNIDYRIKTFYSTYKKLKRKDWNIEEIYDIFALRIIVSDIEECYKTLGIIHGMWRFLPGKIKDYISCPKPNNYQALHTTVFTGYGNVVEIQIKTKKMHQEAEYGIASHIAYKENIKKGKIDNFLWIKRFLPFKIFLNQEKEKKEKILNDIPTWIKDFVEYQKNSSKKEEEDIKSDFFQQRIFIFTPKGDVIDLPIDSSPIDFAYAIHSDIGDHIAGAKVNGKMVSLETKLVNNDIVEILTKKEGKPHKKWLECVKTTTAKKHIRTVLQKEKVYI
jgi:GTP pyrophosphokinase